MAIRIGKVDDKSYGKLVTNAKTFPIMIDVRMPNADRFNNDLGEIKTFAENYEGKVPLKIYCMDTETSAKTMRHLNIGGVPMLLLFVDAKRLVRLAERIESAGAIVEFIDRNS